ncbi:MAG: exodeoxyribonuclease VII large subunit, partial [Candidatus Izemoplasmatales bacterium]
HAAEIAVKNYRDIVNDINTYKKRLASGLKSQYNISIKHFQQVVSRPVLKEPLRLIQTKELKFDNLYDKLYKSNPLKIIENKKERVSNQLKMIKSEFKHYLNTERRDFSSLVEKLELVSPLNIMKKGYAIVKQDNIIKKSISEINETKLLQVMMYEGEITSKIITVERKKNE